MKSPRIRIAIKMPMPTPGRALKAGLAQFAHHPPADVGGPKRMERPRGGKGPKN
jgi:hypothetical protein